MAKSEEVRLYLVREVEREAGWWSREFMRVLFTKTDGKWTHHVAIPNGNRAAAPYPGGTTVLKLRNSA